MVGVPLVSRRTALTAGAGAAAGTVAGCGVETSGAAASGATPSPDPDLRLLRRAVQREERLATEVRNAARRHPPLRSRLKRLVAVHEEHIELLSRSLEAGTRTRTTHLGSPAGAQDAVRGLARSERLLAEAHAHAALDARSGPLARVLAGMAAAADQQAHLLDGLATSVPRRG